MGLFGYSFLKLIFVLKNKEDKENMNNTFRRIWFMLFKTVLENSF